MNNDTYTPLSFDLIEPEFESRLPCPLTDDPSFVYYNSASTDVTRTWRKHGWKPLSEQQGATPT